MNAITPMALTWSDTDRPAPVTHLLLGIGGNKDRLRRLIENVMHDERLLSLSERSESFDKLVLATDKASGCRLRLHRFDTQFVDTPHNHRYSFWSLLLSGKYLHTIYGPGRDALRLPRGRLPASSYAAFHAVGAVYGLHHSIVHTATDVAPGTYSLMLRGPKAKVKDDLYKVDANGDPVAPDVPRPLAPTDIQAILSELSTLGVV
jgi:hypothetical protein